MKLVWSCPCEETKLSAEGDILAKPICHCEACRYLQSAPIGGQVVLFKIGTVKADKGSFEKCIEPKYTHHNMLCTNCRRRVFSLSEKYGLDRISLTDLVRCNGRTVPDGCESNMHIYYGERVFDIADNLPKYLDVPEGFGGSGKELNNDGTPK